RLRTRARENLPPLHGESTRPVRCAVPLVPARANAEGWTRGAPRLAQGRVSGLIAVETLWLAVRSRISGFEYRLARAASLSISVTARLQFHGVSRSLPSDAPIRAPCLPSRAELSFRRSSIGVRSWLPGSRWGA